MISLKTQDDPCGVSIHKNRKKPVFAIHVKKLKYFENKTKFVGLHSH